MIEDPSHYFLVERRNVGDLNKEVNARLATGWRPLGPPFWGDGSYAQAMLRDSEVDGQKWTDA